MLKNNPYQQASQQYQQLELQDTVENASPHELIKLLYQGAKRNIATAKVAMEHKQIKEKGESISKAMSILVELQRALDKEKGGDLAKRLDMLYEYVKSILFKANIENNTKKLDEAYRLIQDIEDAWDQITPEKEKKPE